MPTSFAQQRLWFLDRLTDGGVYTISQVLDLSGSLDVSALARSVDALVERHESLRTRFAIVNEELSQLIEKVGSTSLEILDAGDSARANTLAEAIVRRPFDLERGPLFRASLLRIDGDQQLLIIALHHIISDGWSVSVLIKELWELYRAYIAGEPSPLAELPLQYADFADWQSERLQGEFLETQLAFWRGQLEGAPVVDLPISRRRPPVQTFEGAGERVWIPKREVDALRALAGSEGATLFMVLFGALQLLLHRYTEQTDIVVGTPIANRNRSETEGLVGCFVNTLALRTDLSGDPTVRELLGRVREVALEAYEHQDLPFEKLVKELRLERDMSRNPLFQIVLSLQAEANKTVELPELIATLQEPNVTATRLDLELHLRDEPEGLSGIFVYNVDLFGARTIRRLIGHYKTLLAEMIAHPDSRISNLTLLKPSEQQQILVDWNDTSSHYPNDSCLPSLFEAHAQSRPDAIAVASPMSDSEPSELSYGALEKRSNQLARYLTARGVGPDVAVGISTERSLDMIVGMLGILKSGGTYVPLDPEYPAERLAFMIQDAGLRVVLTQAQHRGVLPDPASHASCLESVIFLDSDWGAIAEEPDISVPSQSKPDSIAHIIYTSGSTGRPKGVEIPHRGVARLVLETNYADFSPSDRIGQGSNFSFDAATLEIWAALLNGARLVIIPKDILLAPPKLATALRQHDINILFLTTALLNHVTRELPDAFASLDVLLFGGEAADPASIQAILEHGAPRSLVNLYGPTENTTLGTYHRITAMPGGAATIPIGRPVSNTQAYVLDPFGLPLPIGIPGELYLGGDGLARGYLNQPALTAEKFVQNPYAASSGDQGERLYRTGDRVCLLEDGSLEFLGRIDDQVKIRGFRIELGEIESVLCQYEDLAGAAVTVREDQPGNRQLVAYVIPRKGVQIDIDALGARLRESVPAYMVPAQFVALDTLPLNSNGKVDRDALPAPVSNHADTKSGFIAPVTSAQETVARIWRKFLKLEKMSIHDNFFDLGGHSLLFAQVVLELEEEFGRKLQTKQLLLLTLGQIAAACDPDERAETNARSGSTELGESRQRTSPAPETEPFFFGGGTSLLFGIYQPPVGVVRDRAVVLCYPSGEEYVRLHRAFRQLADDLANAGFPVLRFDYFACGDSEGDCEAGTVEHWVGDISLAIAEAMRRSGLEKTCLMGFRLGATLAMTAGANHPNVDAIALIDPVIRGDSYLDELRERHQEILRYSSVGGPPANSSDWEEEILGFAYGQQLIEELQQLDLEEIPQEQAKPTLVLESREQPYTSRLRQRIESRGSAVTHQHLPRTEFPNQMDRFKIEDVNHVEMPRDLLQAAVAWLTETEA